MAACCTKETLRPFHSGADVKQHLSNINPSNFHDAIHSSPYISHHNSQTPLSGSDTRGLYPVERHHTRTQCNGGVSVLHTMSISHPNSSTASTPTPTCAYSTPSYSSSSVSFAPNSYFSREQSAELRNLTDYVRVDFNPIMESLNFNPVQNSYTAVQTEAFNGWSTEIMDTGVEIKSQVDFRDQTISASALCPRIPCATEGYRRQPATISDPLYHLNTRQIPSPGRNQDLRHFDQANPQPDQAPTCLPMFESINYANQRAYNQKLMFNTGCLPSLSSGALGLNTSRLTAETNTVGPLMRSCSTAQNTSKITQALSVSANDGHISNSSMMTPDSSTTGFFVNKFTTSSDDGEISPTPTNSTEQPRTSNRLRKVAPTLATGRRNLKSEPVDPDEADRRMKRRERNRKSAQKCRERKVQRTHELQTQVECLQLEISRLTQERDNLRNEARQFVSLLQIHCPGVTIPYISCLNELNEACDGLIQSTASSKSDAMRETVPNGWRMKLNYKMGSHAEIIAKSGANDPYSNLPTMVPLNSHTSPTRPKSLFAFTSTDSADNMVVESNANIELNLPDLRGVNNITSDQGSNNIVSSPGSLPVGRCVSVTSFPDPASTPSSSSSSCSSYEIALPAVDPSLSNSILNNHLEESQENHVLPKDVSCMAQALHITSATKPCTMNDDSSQMVGEDWEHSKIPQSYVASKGLNTPDSDQLSPVSPVQQFNIYMGFVGITSKVQCEAESVKETHAVESTCFL